MRSLGHQRAVNAAVPAFGLRIISLVHQRSLAASLPVGLILVSMATTAYSQGCSQPLNPAFYEEQQFSVRKIQLQHPLDFVFFVRSSLNRLKGSLPLQEGQIFSKDKYDRGVSIIDKAFKNDDAFGISLVKVVVVTASIQNCQENGPKTIDVVYRVFSTDPVPSLKASPEKRAESVQEPATTSAELNTLPLYKMKPIFGYEDARRGYGGGELFLRMPGNTQEQFHLLATGSSTSKIVDVTFSGSRTTSKSFLNLLNYDLSYNYTQIPVSDVRSNKSILQARFNGFSKPRDTLSRRTLLRYAASIEAGNQQSDLSVSTDKTLNRSSYGAIRVYVGAATTTRYSEGTLSYGLQSGGAGLDHLTFTKHVGDLTYSRRFPGGTHAPWDVDTRVSFGHIHGNGIPFADKFFGGNSVNPFSPTDEWTIPSGPIVRSIPANRLNGNGLGGTSFYSVNLTLGKVVYFRPLIPAEVENANGFASGITAAENTAQQFFEDDYLVASQEFKDLVSHHAGVLKGDLDSLQLTFSEIKSNTPTNPKLDSFLRQTDRLLRSAQRIIGHATVPDAEGHTNPQGLVTLSNPNVSPLIKEGEQPGVLNMISQLPVGISPELTSKLQKQKASTLQHLEDLRIAKDEIKKTDAGKKARANAERDMTRPREVIDSLRHEVNSYSIGIVGLFDAARIWPDPFATRYAIGGAARFSIVTVNFTAGYAVNPTPHKDLGQGRGAFVFSLTYTNFFR